MSLELEQILGVERYTQLQSEFIVGPTGPRGETGSGFDGSAQVNILQSSQATISGGTASTDLLTYSFAAGDLRTFVDVPLVFVSVVGNGAVAVTAGIKWASNNTGIDLTLAAPALPGSSHVLLAKLTSRVNDNGWMRGICIGGGLGIGFDVNENWYTNGGTVKLTVAQAVAAPNRLTAKMIVAVIKGVG